MSLTIVLTNWRRPDNFRQVLDAILTQNVKPAVFAWNNSPQPITDNRVDWLVNSRPNVHVWARWLMLAQAETDYVANLDDDLLPTDPSVFADAISALETLPDHAAVGIGGWGLVDDRYPSPYHSASDLRPRDRRVDYLFGRFLVARTARLQAVLPASPPRRDALSMREACRVDDIIVSSLLCGGRRRQHMVPAILFGRFKELPGPHGISGEPGFGRLRAKGARLFFHSKQVNGKKRLPVPRGSGNETYR